MESDTKTFLPERSFGDCYWCGAKMQRLQYTMCSDCIRIAEIIPSKAQVLLNTPDLVKDIEGKTTVEKIVPEMRRYVTRTEYDFPRKGDLQRHWETMIEEVQYSISNSDVDDFKQKQPSDDDENITDEEEIKRCLAIERLLRFMLHVAVQQNSLNLPQEGGKKFCVVCGKTTPEEKHMLCLRCRDELVLETPETDSLMEETPSPLKGMATRDMVRNRRGR